MSSFYRWASWVLIGTLFCLPCLSFAAPPHADWRSLETEYFRFHFPAELEAWARRTAARADQVAEEVNAWVGYAPEGRVDIIIADPFSQANGMALPFTGRARMVLLTTPPTPDSVIGHYSDWGELLLIHEHAHVAHLSRPARRGWGLRYIWLPTAASPMLQLPQWASEGYATHVEGKLTGSGRPNSDLRAALIRAWALDGRLPSYGRLAGNFGQDWQTRLQAYLVGSAYYDWLVDREGDQALRDVWARLTAHSQRDFNEAFEGVFGDSPAVLYQRFLAETTHAAIALEERLGREQSDDIWQAFSGRIGSPAISPDGERVALVERADDAAPVLRVYRLDGNEDAYEKWREREEARLEKDPEDVMARRPDSLPREAEHSLPARNGLDMRDPRWLPGRNALLFTRLSPDPHGFASSDLYLWDLDRDRVRQITHQASLHRPDPSPDGHWAVAVQHRDGHSGLVRVALDSGQVEVITPPSLSEIYDQPRVHPDGRRIAYLRHRGGSWQLRLRNLDTGEEEQLADADARDFLAHPSWDENGALYYSRGREGFIAIERWHPSTSGWRSVGLLPALAPAPIPGKDQLLYLRPGPDGWQLMQAATDTTPAAWPTAPDARSAVSNPGGELRLREAELLSAETRPYGAGPQFPTLLLGTRWNRSEAALDLGIKGGDLIGRLDWLAAVSLSAEGSEDGGVLAGHWRGWPLGLSGAVFRERLDLSAQSDGPGGLDALRRTGMLLAADYQRRVGFAGLGLEGGLALSEFRSAGQDRDRDWAWLGLSSDYRYQRGERQLGLGFDGRLHQGRTADEDWSLSRLRLSAVAGRKLLLGLGWQRVSLDDDNGVEALRLGGQTGLVGTGLTRPAQVFEPALPAGQLSGREYEGQAIYLRNADNNLRLFYRRHRMGMDSPGQGEWLALRGMELDIGLGGSLMPVPEIRGLRLGFGLALIQDEPLPDRTRAWINFRYNW